MTKPTIKQITAILTRVLYFIVASALLVALLTTLERGLHPGLLSLSSTVRSVTRCTITSVTHGQF